MRKAGWVLEGKMCMQTNVAEAEGPARVFLMRMGAFHELVCS